MPPPPLLDAHVHFWDPGRLLYPWLEELPSLRQPFQPADLDRAAEGVPLDAFVFVECNCVAQQALEEVRTVAELAASEPRLRGIVAFAELTRPETLRPLLDAYQTIALVRGIRHNIQGEAPGFCLQDGFVEGVREAGRRGFTFDLCATWDQLDEVAELARRCPDTRLVLDHCGKPDIGSREPGPWRRGIDALAALPHVHCKLSGLLTQTGPNGWSEEDLLPYTRHVEQAFGRDRLMYGGDWPVLTLAGTYGEWYQFTRRFTEEWTVAQRTEFFSGNARRFYGI